MAAETRFTLTEQDFVDSARAQYRARLRSLREWLPVIAILAVLAVIYAWVDSENWLAFAFSLAAYLTLFILLVPILLGLSYWWAGRYARRMFRQQSSQPENRMSWDEAGLKIDSDLGKLTAKWSDFHAWRKSSAGFALHINDAIYYLIPGRALTREQAVDLEENLLRGGVKKR